MRIHFSTAIIATVCVVLLLSTIAIVYTTTRHISSVETLAVQSLDSTALAISSAVENTLRSKGNAADREIRQIFSDRVIAYALIADKNGKILFHTNPGLTGTSLPGILIGKKIETGKVSGRRIMLQTGVPAYEFNFALHRQDGSAELLRLVLNTTPADRIVSDARRMWMTVGTILIFLWVAGGLFLWIANHYIRLQRELSQKTQMALIGQMTAVLAHEIRNAIGSIKGYTQWVDEKTGADDPTKKGLAMVLTGTERIELLVNELLLFSRDEAYTIEKISLSPVIKSVLAFLPPWEGKVNVSIETEVAIKADKEKLQRVLMNGIQNAIQAMGDDGTIFISASNDRRWGKVVIKDAGHGIQKSAQDLLFTPFFTTKTSGTGLGLSYSKKVIEGMGGRIDLYNREDENGAVLEIRLPRA